MLSLTKRQDETLRQIEHYPLFPLFLHPRLSGLLRPPGLVPIRAFALRTDTGFSLLSLTRNPGMLTPLALVPVDGYFNHRECWHSD